MKRKSSNITRVDHLPQVEIETVPGQGHYVVVDGRQWARFDDREHAAQCCATIINGEVERLTRKEVA